MKLPYPTGSVSMPRSLWDDLPRNMQQQILDAIGARNRALAAQSQTPFARALNNPQAAIQPPPGLTALGQTFTGPRYMSPLQRKHHERRMNLRSADGGLVGYRYWKLDIREVDGHRDYVLVSPHQGTIWEGPVLVADNWSNSSAHRGVAGIHATYRRKPDYSWESGTQVPHEIWGRVRGYGEFVRGTDGWRAERVIVDKLWIPSIIGLLNGCIIIPNLMKTWGIDIKDRLRERYECKVVQVNDNRILVVDPARLP